MADFLYLFRNVPVKQSPEQMQKTMPKWQAWMGELAKAGALKGGEPLAPEGRQLVGKAKRLVDGPFTEAKDVVGGYLIVTAKDLNHATELARGCPIFDEEGQVEIRPIGVM